MLALFFTVRFKIFTLRHSAVFYMGFHNRYAVIFQVIVDIYRSDSEILCRGFMHSLLEVSIEPQNLGIKQEQIEQCCNLPISHPHS